MANDPSNDLGEKMTNLPIELLQKILFSIVPRERCHLRLASKAMRIIVDMNMSDVQDIVVEQEKEKCEATITTVNPHNGETADHKYTIVPSSLAFLLKWVGVQAKSLTVKIHVWPAMDYILCTTLNRVFEALNSENAFPKLINFSLAMNQTMWDNIEIILNELLKYVTKRQLQAMTTDHPIPFLHSLSLTDLPDCADSKVNPIDSSDREKMRQMLQNVLDQCLGLKVLDVDNLLRNRSLSLESLRYPATLTYLKRQRLNWVLDELRIIADNCPNLQIIKMNCCSLSDHATVNALASLSDLRELTLESYSTDEEVVQLTKKSIEAFEEHPFGASIARPWPHLTSITINLNNIWTVTDDCYLQYTLVLSGANCCITSLSLTLPSYRNDYCYFIPVQRLFKALNTENACPNLMELNISSCEVASFIAFSLATPKGRQRRQLQRWPFTPTNYPQLPTPLFCGILDDLLAYVTKRQSEVRLGKPFLHMLSLTSSSKSCVNCDDRLHHIREQSDKLEEIHNSVQQILDQCHGLKVLYIDSLNDEMVNSSSKTGKQLMEMVALRFPTTLKKLNSVRLDDFPKRFTKC